MKVAQNVIIRQAKAVIIGLKTVTSQETVTGTSDELSYSLKYGICFLFKIVLFQGSHNGLCFPLKTISPIKI